MTKQQIRDQRWNAEQALRQQMIEASAEQDRIARTRAARFNNPTERAAEARGDRNN